MASTGEVWKLGHRPALDGVRGIAVLMVVLCHSGLGDFAAAGNAGVTVFFTLSGFLITTLLLSERRSRGSVDLRRFFARRARRLLPAVVAMLGIVASALAVAGFSGTWLIKGTVPVLFYFGNWVRAGGDYLGYWSHTWSLAVEEQFYIVWPLLLALPLRRWGARRVVVTAAVVGIVYANVARLVMWDGGAGLERIYYGADTRADALLWGCLLAAWMHGRSVARSMRWTAPVCLGAIAVFGLTGAGFAGVVAVASVVPLLTVAVLSAAVRGGGVGPLEWRPMVWVGRRSYAVYLWNYPLALLVGSSSDGWLTSAVLVPLLTFAFAELSWRLVERPAMRLQRQDVRPDRVVRRGGRDGVEACVGDPVTT